MRTGRRRGGWLPVGAYLVLIFGLSSIPHLAPPGNISNTDKIAHFLEYGILGFLLFRALSARGTPSGVRAAWATVLIGVLVAALDELYQGVVGRDRSLGDWGADAAGLTVAALAGILRIRRRRPGSGTGSRAGSERSTRVSEGPAGHPRHPPRTE